MSKIAVITDSNAHITPQEAEKLGISVVPMPFMIGDETFYEGITLSREEFYEKMESGANIATSQPSPSDVMKIWDEALKTHDEVVYIPMSSGLSGSCQSARMLADDYDGKVQVVNNQRISVTQKRSVLDALEMAEMGMSAAEIREELEHVKYESSIYIMLDTLYYLKKGGRITPAAAAVGTLLRIKPVLQIKGERLDAFSKARTMNQGKNIMINAMKHDIETLYGGTDKENVWLYAVHGNVPDQFAEFSQEVRAAFPAFKVQDDVLSLSIACHIGPGALAIACSKKIPLHKDN
ncbi:MAG: DegV family protein [Lachnospiraceae bacterium]|nr:DegV family protein [Lachnospiraceae bacterium]MBQ8330811.1 DegV family protein [Lachnospiraceae bacterium]